jgi:TRAP-type mannitol/chloroaromatic compound transport system substrate-binding protein
MATAWPRGLDTIFGGVERMARNIETMTDGRLQISVHPAGEIAPAGEALEVARRGAVEMGHAASHFFLGLNPAFIFDSSVPFGLNAVEQSAWHYHGGGLETMQRLFADLNVISFPTGNTGVQMGGWFKREIRTLADVRGIRIRMPGLGGEVWNRLGATAQLIPPGEIFLALERGVVDAADFIGAHDDMQLGLHRAARFYYYPGWQEPSGGNNLYINLARWRELPRDYQEVIKVATITSNLSMLAHYAAVNGPAMDRLIRGGTVLRPFPRELMIAAERFSAALKDEHAARDATFRAVVTDWRRFRDTLRRNSRFTEYAFKHFVFSPR